MNDSEVEHIIPITLQVDDTSNDDEDELSDVGEQLNQDPDSCTFDQNRDYSSHGNFVGQFGRYVRDPAPPRGAYNIYQPLPPTINIFACPPPPPPGYGAREFSGQYRSPAPSTSVSMPPDFIGYQPPSEPRPGTPPPPELTKPFHCEDTKHQITNHRSQASRFHPYQRPKAQEHSRMKRSNGQMSNDPKNFLCIDAQDFSASDISIKVKDRQLTIEGTKPSNQTGGRFVSMRHEYTFSSPAEAQSTSCTFHPNGTLILQFKHDSESSTYGSVNKTDC